MKLGTCRNSDGSWNGVKTMAKLTGMSEEEVLNLWNYIKTLKDSGLSSDDIRAAVKQEVKAHRGTNS